MDPWNAVGGIYLGLSYAVPRKGIVASLEALRD